MKLQLKLVALVLLFVLFGCGTIETVQKSFDYSVEYGTEEFDGGIVFYGDTQKHHDIHMAVLEKILSFEPKAIFHLGDMVSEGDNKKEWETFDKIVKNVRSTLPYYPVIGNHEKGVDPDWYFNHWDMNIGNGYYSLYVDGNGVLRETRNISEDERNIKLHITVLHSNPGFLEKGEEQYKWLIEDLDRFKEVPTILVFHIPLYMAGTHYQEQGENHPAKVLYEIMDDSTYNIKAAISGHDRAYQRFTVDGIKHLITGNSGETPNPQKVFNNNNLDLFVKDYNFTLMKINETNIVFSVFNKELNIIDSFTIDL